MKTLAFVVCILATITIGDAALISNLVNTLVTSIIFDIKVLIDFQRTYTQCALELGLLKSLTREISFCVAEKKNLVDEEGALKWDMTYDYMAKLIRDENKIDFLNEYFKKCKKISDNFKGNGKEKTLIACECGLPLVGYIMRQSILL